MTGVPTGCDNLTQRIRQNGTWHSVRRVRNLKSNFWPMPEGAGQSRGAKEPSGSRPFWQGWSDDKVYFTRDAFRSGNWHNFCLNILVKKGAVPCAYEHLSLCKFWALLLVWKRWAAVGWTSPGRGERLLSNAGRPHGTAALWVRPVCPYNRAAVYPSPWGPL